ncbi:MAG: hypothetical protein KFH98_02805 [Gemmatimonadetes bacterium]|nr:hypothetical protein [Gemmatimonadota bacterium]
MTLRHFLLLLAVTFAPLADGAAAQQPDPVVGRIIGPDNLPLGGQTVVLHRVQAAAGATVAETVTAEDGRFELLLPAGSDTSAVFFVATRHAGELYIGAPFRAGEQTPGGQIIQVGLPGTSATAMLESGSVSMPQPIGRPLTNRNWLLLVIPLVGVSAVAVYALIPRSRVAPDRAMLIRIAELDERMGSAPGPHRAAMLEERNRLMTRLREG